VEGNPVRAGSRRSAKEWLGTRSSHKERIYRGSESVVNDVPIELPVNWDRYVDEPLGEKELERLRQSVNRQSPYGQTEWQIKITQRFGLESTLRPKKEKTEKEERR
jgi:putative transposase